MIEIVKEIRLKGTRESISWSRDKEERFPETRGETVSIVDVMAIGVVRSGTYAKSMEYFQLLMAEARKDFPGLTDADFRVVHFGGDRYKRTMGLEFDVPGNPSIAPDGWTSIRDLEKTL